MLQLANNSQSDSQPKITRLPLPVSDSPLVIDLPDGQKIVIGKMAPGSVIEVATWRGVGRPDSRTSRMMLGVGGAGSESEASQVSDPTPASKVAPKNWRAVPYYLNLAFKKLQGFPWKELNVRIRAIIAKKQRVKKIKEETVVESKDLTSALPSLPLSSSSKATDLMDLDIEAWLNKISEKSAAKGRTEPIKAAKSREPSVKVTKVVKKTAKPKVKRK